MAVVDDRDAEGTPDAAGNVERLGVVRVNDVGAQAAQRASDSPAVHDEAHEWRPARALHAADAHAVSDFVGREGLVGQRQDRHAVARIAERRRFLLDP